MRVLAKHPIEKLGVSNEEPRRDEDIIVSLCNQWFRSGRGMAKKKYLLVISGQAAAAFAQLPTHLLALVPGPHLHTRA